MCVCGCMVSIYSELYACVCCFQITYAIGDAMETVSFTVPPIAANLSEFGFRKDITVTFRLPLYLV